MPPRLVALSPSCAWCPISGWAYEGCPTHDVGNLVRNKEEDQSTLIF